MRTIRQGVDRPPPPAIVHDDSRFPGRIRLIRTVWTIWTMDPGPFHLHVVRTTAPAPARPGVRPPRGLAGRPGPTRAAEWRSIAPGTRTAAPAPPACSRT